MGDSGGWVLWKACVLCVPGLQNLLPWLLPSGLQGPALQVDRLEVRGPAAWSGGRAAPRVACWRPALWRASPGVSSFLCSTRKQSSEQREFHSYRKWDWI